MNGIADAAQPDVAVHIPRRIVHVRAPSAGIRAIVPVAAGDELLSWPDPFAGERLNEPSNDLPDFHQPAPSRFVAPRVEILRSVCVAQ